MSIDKVTAQQWIGAQAIEANEAGDLERRDDFVRLGYVLDAYRTNQRLVNRAVDAGIESFLVAYEYGTAKTAESKARKFLEAWER